MSHDFMSLVKGLERDERGGRRERKERQGILAAL
jgi:hypothetical protein